MLTRFLFLLSCSIVYLPTALYAACSKEDIEFYLDKGFSQEQITQLCATGESSVPDYKPYQQQVIIYTEEESPGVKGGFTREERIAIKDLQQGTDVLGMTVDQDKMQYTVRVCLAVQEGKEFSQRFKACPEVFYTVLRSGLKVINSGKQFGFFGQSAIVIKGVIKSEPKQNFDDYPPQFRKQLKRNFDWKTDGDTTKIPVRGDYSVTKLVNALNAIATEADPNATFAQNDSDDDVAIKDETDKPKKKKRWWNPFD